MEFKGTKGSWFVVNINDHPTHKGEQVAFIQTATHAFDVGAVEESFINRETFKANAQLIAHAPEMLEAMQSFVSGFESDYVLDDGTIVDSPYEWLVVEYHKCKDLLTRATTI